MIVFKEWPFKRRLINKEVTASASPGRETGKKILIHFRIIYPRKTISGIYHADSKQINMNGKMEMAREDNERIRTRLP